MNALNQSRNDSNENELPVTPGVARQQRGSIIILACIIALATALTYLPVMFNFFAGDDFVHLTWLKDAVIHPELITKNFHSSWLDGTTTKFYRPLISVFMVTDYLMWGINGFGFHLTNVLFHTVSTVVLFFITLRIGKTFEPALEEIETIPTSPLSGSALTFAFFSALTFGLYPLHPEAVSWITGRVDTVVTTFIVISLWCYMQWRDSKKLLWCASAILSMILALLSKEMAITLPAAFIAYELLLMCEKGFKRASIVPMVVDAIKATVPFWFVIALYFVVRYFALGTFVGGYDDSLFFISNMKEFLLGWAHALKMLFVPANKELLSAHSLLVRFWLVSLGFIAISSLVNFVTLKRMLPALAFALMWIAFSLAPVYKLFAIADDLQGSRLAYLATVPLSLLLAFGFTTVRNAGNPVTWMRIFNRVRIVWGILFLAAAAIMLWTNNQAWVIAGEQSAAIRQGLSKLYSELEGDPQVLFVGLPDQKHGAYISRNALMGMTKKPQMERDIFNCIMVDKFEPIMPFGFLKNSLQDNRDKVKAFRWDEETKVFSAIAIPAKNESASAVQKFAGADLKRILSIDDKWGIKSFDFDAQNVATVETESPSARRPALKVNLQLPCFATDFVAVKVQALEKPTDDKGMDILYTNDINKDFNLYHRAHANLSDSKDPQTLIFTFHSSPEWVFGGTTKGLELYLPLHAKFKILSIETVPATSVMPVITFQNSGYMGTKGYLHLGKDKLAETIDYDCTKVAGAASVEAEITRTNLLFATQNTDDASLVIMKTLKSSGTTGTIKLERTLFPALGIYELRMWAVDKNGKKIGVSGDHIVISVDS